MHNKLIAVLIGLIFIIWGGTAGAQEKPVNSQTKETLVATYPPYPDVWDWQVPNPEAYVPGWLRTYLLDNGDVLIVYTQRKTSGAKGTISKDKGAVGVDRKMTNLYSKVTDGKDVSGEVESKQVTFFGGLTVLDEPSNV
jgi:hypothetical protein